MLSPKVEAALNAQIALEGYSSFIYLAMASWCEVKGLHGCTRYMRRQSDEERMHMLKIFDYIAEMDGRAITPAIEQPRLDYDSVLDMFEYVYEQERRVTRSIYELNSLSAEENDFSTQNFLQWYITEQREEEALVRSILDRIKLIGDGPMSLFYIDKEVASINAHTEATEGAE